jgi:hypothetical protein
MSDITAEFAEDAEFGMEINDLTESVIGAAMEVHRSLGPGLLESTYELCACRESSLRALRPLRLIFDHAI